MSKTVRKLREQMLDVELEQLMKANPKERETYEEVIRARQLSRTLPFDPRNELSTDAKYVADRIVGTMWTIFVLLPVVVGLLLAALYSWK